MKERPIRMTAPEVRAILDGHKTQKRLVVKPQPPKGADSSPLANVGHPWHNIFGHNGAAVHRVCCPYGQPGDRLWVRETWAPYDEYAIQARDRNNVFYRADDNNDYDTDGQWRPSIHMPRWASRILLEITGLRIERLQDLSENDALADGIVPAGDGNGFQLADTTHYSGNPVDSYFSLWEHINGPGSVEANPWVWVIEFQRVRP